jgi:hypothetical protein
VYIIVNYQHIALLDFFLAFWLMIKEVRLLKVVLADSIVLVFQQNLTFVNKVLNLLLCNVCLIEVIVEVAEGGL